MNNNNNERNEKKARREVKKILKREEPRGPSKAIKRQVREDRAARAIKVVQKAGRAGPLTRGQSSTFRRAFTDRDAARLAWMLTVCDPFGKHHWAVPPIIAPGIPLSAPRIYRLNIRGFAEANASGRVYIGANADMWLPDSFRAALTNAQPMYGFLGNNPSNDGGVPGAALRGSPVHYTTQWYNGCDTGSGSTPIITGSTGLSYPASTVTSCNGLVFGSFPDNFINTQLPASPTSGDAYQRCTNISVGLRVRPTAPASGALVPQGVILMTQQTLGDTVQTNAAAASSPTAIGGVDVYAYLCGLTGSVPSGTNASNLTDEMIARQEWDVMEWPRDKKGKTASWLTAAAIPNQSCSLGAYVPKMVGDTIIAYPQLVAIGSGMLQGQVVEFEASYAYAFYGAVSYEVNAHKEQSAVPLDDLANTASAAADHMDISRPTSSPARQALAATVQPAISSGELPKKDAASWVNSGKEVIEAATGSSIGELIGEGLGFLGAILL